jgi:hypothetical protein
MATRFIEKDGKYFCLGCSGEEYNLLHGGGISLKK